MGEDAEALTLGHLPQQGREGAIGVGCAHNAWMGPSGDKDAEDLTQNLSALAADNGLIWSGWALLELPGEGCQLR